MKIFYVLLCVRQQGAVYTWFSNSTLNFIDKTRADSDSKKKKKKKKEKRKEKGFACF